MNREFTVIVWGATGFVGQLVSKYLAQNYMSANSSVTFALAGRNAKKLEEVRTSLVLINEICADIEIIVADQNNLNAIARRAQTVIALVGPYAAHGEPMVKACVEEGTHYVDITGEVMWSKKMYNKYNFEAEKKGLKIVSFCGFDSIPFDISAYVLQIAAMKLFNNPAHSIDAVVTKMKGGISGGSIHTGMLMYEEDKKELLSMRDPNYMCPVGTHGQLTPPDEPYYNEDLHCYSSRFIMTPVNSKIVRKSCALLPEMYIPKGEHTITYREGMRTKNALMHHLVNFMTVATAVILFFIPPLRSLIKWAIPAGSGPSEEALKNGYVTVEAIAKVTTKDGEEKKLKSIFRISGDPGYQETAKMVTEAGITAALLGSSLETSHTHKRLVNGLGTPASCLGEDLVERLRAAGFDINTEIFNENKLD
eukprot:GDKJ01004962.1.p1 GENE.GDKJ01004962.1~~GDKJ01004962.1.p1  ORF type:complete len:436 (-),score=111.02 GDKJ01004962.1:234-1499(-)